MDSPLADQAEITGDEVAAGIKLGTGILRHCPVPFEHIGTIPRSYWFHHPAG